MGDDARHDDDHYSTILGMLQIWRFEPEPMVPATRRVITVPSSVLVVPIAP